MCSLSSCSFEFINESLVNNLISSVWEFFLREIVTLSYSQLLSGHIHIALRKTIEEIIISDRSVPLSEAHRSSPVALIQGGIVVSKKWHVPRKEGGRDGATEN